MGKIDFMLSLPVSPEQLLLLSEDYENLPNFLPDQLKSVKIIEKKENETTTEEVIVLKTILTKEITQQALHKKIGHNMLETEILSGPAKGSIIHVTFEKVDSGTKVRIDMELHLGLKAKILEPIIKKWYKIVLTAILYKMNTKILQSNSS